MQEINSKNSVPSALQTSAATPTVLPTEKTIATVAKTALDRPLNSNSSYCSIAWKAICWIVSPITWLIKKIISLFCCVFAKKPKSSIDRLKVLYKDEPDLIKWLELAQKLEHHTEKANLTLDEQRKYLSAALRVFTASQPTLLNRLPNSLEALKKMDVADKKVILDYYCLYLDFFDLFDSTELSPDILAAHQNIYTHGSQLQRSVLDEIGFPNLGNTCWFNSLLQFFISNIRLIDFGKPSVSGSPESRETAKELSCIHKALKRAVRTLHSNSIQAITELYQSLTQVPLIRRQLKDEQLGYQEEPGGILFALFEAFGSKINREAIPVEERPFQTTLTDCFGPRGTTERADPNEDFFVISLNRFVTRGTSSEQKRKLIAELSAELIPLQGKPEKEVADFFSAQRQKIEQLLGHSVSDQAIADVVQNFIKPPTKINAPGIKAIVKPGIANMLSGLKLKDSAFENLFKANVENQLVQEYQAVYSSLELEQRLSPFYLGYQLSKINNDLQLTNGRFVEIALEGGAKPSTRYEIIASIVHQGTDPSGGHYVAYRKGQDGVDRCYNDSFVSDVATDRVTAAYSQGYYLYLKKAPFAMN